MHAGIARFGSSDCLQAGRLALLASSPACGRRAHHFFDVVSIVHEGAPRRRGCARPCTVSSCVSRCAHREEASTQGGEADRRQGALVVALLALLPAS